MGPQLASLLSTALVASVLGCGGGEAPHTAGERDTVADAGAAEGTQDEGTNGRSATGLDDARPAPAGRLAIDRRFPAIPVEPLRHGESLLKARQWTIVAMAPRACEPCGEEVSDWILQAELWTSGTLRAVVVAEGGPGSHGEWVDEVAADGSGMLAFTTDAPMFRYTGELNRPVFTLVDTMGVVRFIGRHSGTVAERWMSLGRNHRYQSANVADRETIVRSAFPSADRIEIRRTSESPQLGAEMIGLGISPWYGAAYHDGRLMGYGLPIERDTDCDSCDPLYLLVAVTRGQVLSLHEIEPVVSLGERETTGTFFQALVGVGSAKDVAGVRQMLRSPKADRAVREILSVALAAAKRLEPESRVQ